MELDTKEAKRNNLWVFKTELIDAFTLQSILLPQLNDCVTDSFMQIKVLNIQYDNLNKKIRNWMIEKSYKPANCTILDSDGNTIEKWELSIRPTSMFVEELNYLENNPIITTIGFSAKILDIK